MKLKLAFSGIFQLFAVLLTFSVALAAPEYAREKNVATRIQVEFRNSSTGALITTGTAACYCKTFTNGASPADVTTACSTAAPVQVGTTGIWYQPLTSGETNEDFVVVRCTNDATNAIPFVASINTRYGAQDKTANALANVKQWNGNNVASFYDGQIAGESGTDLTLAANQVDVDNQFAYTHVLTVFDANGLSSASSCIVGSTASNEHVLTEKDISGFLASGDNYTLKPDGGCAALRPSTEGRKLDVATTGESGVDLSNVNGTLDAAEIGSNAFALAKFASDYLSDISSRMDTALATYDAPTNAEMVSQFTTIKGAGWSSGTDTLEQIRDNQNLLCTLADNSITAAKIATDAGNEIADFVLRRNFTNAESASGGQDSLNWQSLLGAGAKQTNNVAVSGSNLNIYRADGVTLFKAQTLTSSAGASPITGLGN